MKQEFRWGIIGTGRIIHRWLPDFFKAPGAVLGAVCSTALDKAKGIAERYAPEALCFDSVERLVKEGNIDAAYIATSHSYHLEAARQCLEAGIPVLCEKPITPTGAQAREMTECARSNGTFLMEAMWTRFFPTTAQVLDWIGAGEIGEIVELRGSFTGGPLRYNPQDRIFRADTGGGALLDIGVYLIHWAAFAFGGMPLETASLARLGEENLDYSDNILLRFPGGGVADLHCSLLARDRDTVTINGARGSIFVDEHFWKPTRAVLRNDRGEVSCHYPVDGEGFQFEVAHVQECVAKGLKESPVMPLSRSVEVLELCDSLRREWGVRYPFDRP